MCLRRFLIVFLSLSAFALAMKYWGAYCYERGYVDGISASNRLIDTAVENEAILEQTRRERDRLIENGKPD